MAKITEYPVTTNIQNDDVLLVDGVAGTRGLSVSGFSEAVAQHVVNDSQAFSGLVGDVNDLKSDLNTYANVIVGIPDVIIGATIVRDAYLSDTGVATTQTNFFYTQPIDVVPGERYTAIIPASVNSNPFRIHGYINGTWDRMLLKQTVGGDSQVGYITFTVPEDITQIAFSCRNDKIPVACYPYGENDLYAKIERKIDKEEVTILDTANSEAGYVRATGEIVESGNWRHIKVENVKIGSLVTASAYNTTALPMILLFDTDNTLVQSITPAESGVTTNSITTISDGTIYVNYSSTYSFSGNISKVYDLDNIIANIQTVDEKTKIPYLAMIHKFGIAGDSLSSGEIWNGSSVRDCYNYSWLSNIARNIGAECVHYSKGGLTAKAWWLDTDGYKTALAAETEKPSAYYIAFGTNDKNQSEYPIGTISDTAGTDSFVGYMRAIIEYIHTEQSNAVIFLVSTYNTSTASEPYNEIIEAIAGLYSYCFFIDYANSDGAKTTQNDMYVENSHFTTIGYLSVARVIKELTENVITANLAWYKHFGLNNYSV